MLFFQARLSLKGLATGKLLGTKLTAMIVILNDSFVLWAQRASDGENTANYVLRAGKTVKSLKRLTRAEVTELLEPEA